MATQAIPVFVSGEQRLSQWTRLESLFFQPNRLFEDIRRDSSWWLPFVLTVICSYGLTFLSASRIGFHQLTENMMRAEPALAQQMDESMSPEQQATAINTAETSFKISSFAVPALVLLYNAGYALLLLVGLNFAGGRVSFGSIFGVLLYADMIQNVRSVLSIVAMYMVTERNQFNIQNPVGTNIGFYFPMQESGLLHEGWLHTLMNSMDIVTVWYLFIIALGCSIVARVSRGSAMFVVFGLWLIILTGRVMWAAI